MKKKGIPEGYKPSAKDAEWFVNHWAEEEKFSAPVKAMFKICQETFPKNINKEEVLLKCAVVNSFSSTNVLDLNTVANHIVNLRIDERLNNNDLSLVKDISEVEIGEKIHTFYSFASKYCHYHKPETYAIYDSYVAKVLCSFPKDFGTIKERELRNYPQFIKVLKEFRQHYGLNLSLLDLDKYLWQLGRWYLNKYGVTYKYYNREDENPYSDDDYRRHFWHGEMMFVTTHQNVGYWKEEGREWLKSGNEHIKQLARKYSAEQFGLITYISSLGGKWFPYDNQEWIFEY